MNLNFDSLGIGIGPPLDEGAADPLADFHGGMADREEQSEKPEVEEVNLEDDVNIEEEVNLEEGDHSDDNDDFDPTSLLSVDMEEKGESGDATDSAADNVEDEIIEPPEIIEIAATDDV